MAKLFDAVLEQARIRDVLQYYGLRIERNKVLCPFHDDQHPSMGIDDKRQIVKCFSCGEGGNAISFVQKYEERVNHHSMSITESAIKVVEICNLDIDVSNLKKQNEALQYQVNGKRYSPSQKESLALLQRSNEYYEYVLHTEEGQTAKEYLLKRGLSEKIIKDLRLGFAQKGLLEKLGKTNATEFSEFALQSAGLMKNGNEVFVNRVMFPIADVKGNIVGFGGRATDSDSIKYLNTQETEVFQKADILYNLHSAKNYAYKEKLFVVEGYMDVVGAKILGIDNVVALMGTNLSDSHMEQIKATKNEVILALDNDDAGKTATLKHIVSLEKAGIPVSVLDISAFGTYKDFGDLSLASISKADIESKIMSSFQFILETKYFKEHDFNVSTIANEYTKLVDDGVVSTTKHKAEFIEFMKQRTKLRKEELLDVIEPKLLQQKSNVELLQEHLFERHVATLVKAYLVEKKDAVLEEYVHQNEQSVLTTAITNITSNPIRYCDKAFREVNIAMVLYDTLSKSEQYANFEKVRRFHYEEIFDHAFTISGDVNGQLNLTDTQKAAILNQYEKTIPNEEKLMLENVQEVYIINEIQDIDKLLPDILHEARRGYIKESMQIEKCMSYLNYGSVFAEKQISFLSERYVKDGKFKTILFFNNLNKELQLTKDNLVAKKANVMESKTIEKEDKEKDVVVNHEPVKQQRITCTFEKEDVEMKDGFAYIRSIVEGKSGFLKVNAKNMKLKDEQCVLYTMSNFSYSFFDKDNAFLTKVSGADISKGYECYVNEVEDKENSHTTNDDYNVSGKEEMVYG